MARSKSTKWSYWGKILVVLMLPFIIWTLIIYRDGARLRTGFALGYNTVHAMASAQQTQTFRLDPNNRKIMATGKAFGAAETRQITNLAFTALQTTPGYFGPHKNCEPMPGVMFKLSDGQEPVDVMLCFDCDILIVSSSESRRFADFDSRRPQWLHLVKVAFPNDKTLRMLQDQR